MKKSKDKEVVWLIARAWHSDDMRYRVNAWLIRDYGDAFIAGKTLDRTMQDYITKGHEFEILEICRETEADYLRGSWGSPSDKRYDYWCGVFEEGLGEKEGEEQ